MAKNSFVVADSDFIYLSGLAILLYKLTAAAATGDSAEGTTIRDELQQPD
jgi:hypothetical protein